MLIGQDRLLYKINSYNIDTFPRSVLVLGEQGSGRHTLISYISENVLKLPMFDITDKLSDEFIDEIYRTSNPNIYIINLDNITEKTQNVLLKFVEEPLSNSFIFLICESTNFVLPTILNRCIIFELAPYTKEDLYQFIPENIKFDNEKNLIVNLLRTPGQIINTNIQNIKDLYELCQKMTTKLNVANYANTLSIGNKLNYKDMYDKFDINIFLNTLSYTLYNEYLTTNNKNILSQYLLVINERKKLIDKRLNKEHFIQNLLTKLWRAAQ